MGGGAKFGFLVAVVACAQTEPVSVGACLYDYAQLPAPMLEQARAHSARILGKAGLEVTWYTCPGMEPACSTPRRPDHLEVRILTSSRIGGGAPPTQLGFAFQPADGTPGTLANVLADRATRWAVNQGMDPGVLLGHAIAHELGHLLLGIGEHSGCGLMTEHWGTAQFTLAMQGCLNFSARDAAAIRTHLAGLRHSTRPARPALEIPAPAWSMRRSISTMPR